MRINIKSAILLSSVALITIGPSIGHSQENISTVNSNVDNSIKEKSHKKSKNHKTKKKQYSTKEIKHSTEYNANAKQLAHLTPQQLKQKFLDLKKEVSSSKANMETYFQYGQLAFAIGDNTEAVKAYQYMLSVNPNLQRVKLELALVYTKIGNLKEAKQLFDSVLSTNPPPVVKKNIETVLAKVNGGLKKDIFSGVVATGYNINTNTNSAASSGYATFSDLSIPLTPSSKAHRDSNIYAFSLLTHVHKFDIDSNIYKLTSETTGTIYKSHQTTVNSLDLGLASIRTGPAIEFPSIKTKFGFNGMTSIVELDGNGYLKTRGWESNFAYTFSNKLLFSGAYSYEYRKFINTLTSLTYTDRSGNANQQTFGVFYSLTPKDIFNATITWRHENAENQAFGNTQEGIIGGYTRQLPWDLSFNTSLGFRKLNYHSPDPLVSAVTLRHDRERNMTYTLTRKLPHNIIASVAYQYKNVTSNIQNYDYTDNKYSASLGWTF